ncbi:unnamed protein product, partial [Effrenium voratum]
KADEHTTPVSGLWAIPSLLNHACLPSTVAVPLTKTTLAFVAARGMPAGAELTTRYCQLQLPLAQRRAELKRQKGFDCHCRRCEVESIVPDQLSRKLLEAQQRAAALDLPPTDFLTALNEVAAITRREVVACATEANQSQATQVLLASYSSVFLSRAMALEVAGADSRAAWEELRELLAQLERELLGVMCLVSAPSALSAAQQDAAMAAFQRQTEAQGPLDWQNILGLLKQHGSWAKEVEGEAHRWELRDKVWRLHLPGFDAGAQLDISGSLVRLRSDGRLVEVNVPEELRPADVSRVKAQAKRGALCVDFPKKSRGIGSNPMSAST